MLCYVKWRKGRRHPLSGKHADEPASAATLSNAYFVYACKLLLDMIAITVLTVYHCSFNHSGGMICHDVF